MKNFVAGYFFVLLTVVSCSLRESPPTEERCELNPTTIAPITNVPTDYPTESPEELHDRAMLGPGDIAELERTFAELENFEYEITYSGQCEEKIEIFLEIVRLFKKEIRQMIQIILDDIAVNGRRRRRDVVKKCRQSFKKVMARCTLDTKYLFVVLNANLTIVNDFYTQVIDKINLSELNENEVYLVEIIKFLGRLWEGDVSNIKANLNLGSNPPPQDISNNTNIRAAALEQVVKIQQHNNSMKLIYEKISAAIDDTLQVSLNYNKTPHAVITPIVRIFKTNFVYYIYDLLEKYIAETPFYLDNNGTLGMFNSTANELYFNFGKINSNIQNGTSLNGRNLENVIRENLGTYDLVELYWRLYKLADFSQILPPVISLR